MPADNYTMNSFFKSRTLIILFGLLVTTKLFALDTLNTKLYQHAKNTPVQHYNQITDLVKYLSIPTKTESERVEIFVYWISLNVSYDIYEYSIRDNWSDDIVHNLQDAYSVFKTRKAVCAGFSNLLKAMCEASNIKCNKISGYSKGFGYTEGVIPNRTDHAWNAVLVENKWCLVDATWTEGYAKYENNKMVAIKKLNIKEIFMDAKEFITKHLPIEPQWQLLTNPMPMNAFFANINYEKMSNSKMASYNFNDTIKFYENLPEDEKKIKRAENRYRFTQDKWEFAFSCFYYAQDQGWRYEPTLEELTQALTYYRRAKELFENFSGNTPTTKIKECVDRINYINNQIASLNKH